MADAVDGLDHRPVDWIIGHVLDESTVNLQEVHWQVFEVSERGHAGAEIVQRKQAPDGFELIDEIRGLVELRDRGGLGDLEADALRHHREMLELLAHVFKKALVADRCAGEVDCEDTRCRVFVSLPSGDDGKCIANHPAIDRRHQVVAFRGGDKRHRQHQFATLVEHANQDLAVVFVLARQIQPRNFLRIQDEAVVLKGLLQSPDPLHFALPNR